LGTPPDTVFEPPVLLTQFLGDGGMVPCLCALVARRDLVLEVGGYDESIQHLYEDQVFLAKMCLAAPVYTEDGCGERYRQHPDSSSAQAIQSGAYNPFWPNEARLAYLNWLTHYIKERGISDNALQKALARSFRPYNHPYLYRFITPLSYFWMHTRGYLDFMISIAKKILVPKPNLGTRKQPSDSSTKRPAGTVDFGNLRRVQPVSREFGYDRGLPIDRYYIEKFLAAHQQDICGRVLEIGDDSYTRHFGGERVTTRDVLHVAAGDPAATFVGDLTQAEHIPSAAFDCFILTQTLHLIYDVRKALQTIYRILKPGGVVLATFPGISQISSDRWANNWHWSFTTLSARRLFEEVFPDSGITMEVYGNVLTATAFLQGLAVEELSQAELDYQDPNYEFLITIRAQKPR
jgi:SAM-dependent methyltransferase